MKKKIIKIILLLLLFIAIVCFSMMIIPLYCDEIWEYGYGYNISTGLTPYRDFNMLVTPLFPFCISLFIKIFGPYLLSAHIFNAILLILMISMMYKIIGNKTLIIVPLMLYSTYAILPTYNGLITFLTILLIYMKQTHIKEDNKILLSGLIISLMVLTKQSIGAVFFILEIFLTKDKKKYLLTFSIPIILFVIYLIINKALYNFIDYSILGMLDFADNNSRLSFWLVIFIIMCITLMYLYKKHKNNSILYALAFMSMCIPIYEESHTMPPIIVFTFIILQFVKYKKYLTKYFIIYSIIFLLFFVTLQYKDTNNNKIYREKTFLYMRNIANINNEAILNELTTKIEDSKKKYDKYYFFGGTVPYIIKLNMKEKIDKYDMILNGNMGYRGAQRYIEEIDNYCQNNKCLFILEEYNKNKKGQVNREIIDHIREKYIYLEETKYFYYYSN